MAALAQAPASPCLSTPPPPRPRHRQRPPSPLPRPPRRRRQARPPIQPRRRPRSAPGPPIDLPRRLDRRRRARRHPPRHLDPPRRRRARRAPERAAWPAPALEPAARHRDAPRREPLPEPHRPHAPAPPQDPGPRCPACGEGHIITGNRGWGCDRWRAGCRFVVWFEHDGVRIPEAEALRLFRFGRTRPFAQLPAAPVPLGLVLDRHAPGNVRWERFGPT
ncbi:MAG: hypothetical protein R3F65_28240 [bacterium]